MTKLPRYWKPLQRATDIQYPPELLKAAAERLGGCSPEEARAAITAGQGNAEFWVNELYQVELRRFFSDGFDQPMVSLCIRRRDGAAIFDWRHRQAIKNQLVGPECEAFELYPAESRLVDTSNKYHLWCFANPELRIGVEIGNGKRDVVEEEVKSPPGMRQRAW